MFSIIREWFSSLSAFQTDELSNLYQLTYLALLQQIKQQLLSVLAGKCEMITAPAIYNRTLQLNQFNRFYFNCSPVRT